MIPHNPPESQAQNRIADVKPTELNRFPAFSHCPYDGSELVPLGRAQRFRNLRAWLGNCPTCGTTRTIEVTLE